MQIMNVKSLPKIIYILGSGASGSTLLGMLLGAHSQMASVGEPSKLDKFVALDLPCTCGERFSNCELWKQLSLRSSSGFIGPLRPKNSPYNLLIYRSGSIRLDPLYSAVVERNLDFYHQVSKLLGKELIVDSSQDLTRFYYLYNSGQIRLAPLLIVRDGRPYIDSMRRRMRMSPVRATLRWIRLNLTTEIILKGMNLGESLIKVNYDSLVLEPERYLKEISSKLNVTYEEEMLNYHTQIYHHIAGAPQRFSPQPVKPQDHWRRKLSSADRMVFSLLGGNYFNRRFGAVP